MKLTKCSNNHFYDVDKFPCCPQCGEFPDTRSRKTAEAPAVASEDRMVCAACGKDCRPGTKFCVHCGGPVKRVSKQNAAPAGEKLVCTSCGKETQKGMKFCVHCGSSLKPAAEQPAAPVEKKAVCPGCGQEAKRGMKFCIGCGMPLQQEAKPLPKPEPVVAKPLCPDCGKELQPGMKFCISCGKAVGTPAARMNPSELVFAAPFPGESEGEATVSDGVISAAQAPVRLEAVDDIPRTAAVPSAPAPVIPVAEPVPPVWEEAVPVPSQPVQEVKKEEPPFFRKAPDLSAVACCTSCGLALRPGSVFCNWCGEEVVFEEEEPNSAIPDMFFRGESMKAPAAQNVREEEKTNDTVPEMFLREELVAAPVPQSVEMPEPVFAAEPEVVAKEEEIVPPEVFVTGQNVQEETLEEAVSNAVEPEYDEYEDEKTVAIYDVDKTEPVVGWLICVKGEYKGQSFELKTRRNTIGRSMKMDVALAKELSVSRDRHAIITYEPIMRKFYIQCGEGSSLTYVNNEVLMIPREISDYDVIRLGNCKLILRTLCNDRYTWNDGE